jgi:thiamine-phosphate pyrophosphorylase
MAESCLLYYITDRSAFPGDERARRQRLLDKIAEAAASGVDYIQLREKDLSARELENLAREAIRVIGENGKASDGMRQASALLINSRVDVAMAVSAAGVHLRADDISPEEVRSAWRACAVGRGNEAEGKPPIIAVSCHSTQEVIQAAAEAANFTVFAPVFEKKDAEIVPAGLEELGRACRVNIPVLALGGVTLENAALCLRAGAAGVAAIRLFQENEISKIVRALRG